MSASLVNPAARIEIVRQGREAQPAIVVDDILSEPERIALYEARPNRGLIYRGHSLHSAAIAPGAELPEDGATGRLTINALPSEAGAAA